MPRPRRRQFDQQARDRERCRRRRSAVAICRDAVNRYRDLATADARCSVAPMSQTRAGPADPQRRGHQCGARAPDRDVASRRSSRCRYGSSIDRQVLGYPMDSSHAGLHRHARVGLTSQYVEHLAASCWAGCSARSPVESAASRAPGRDLGSLVATTYAMVRGTAIHSSGRTLDAQSLKATFASLLELRRRAAGAGLSPADRADGRHDRRTQHRCADPANLKGPDQEYVCAWTRSARSRCGWR